MAGDDVPAEALFAQVVGQPAAVASLRASARHPVHAYLLTGPPGSGMRPAALAFGAALVCPNGGCGACAICTQALAGTHPDVRIVGRERANLVVTDAKELTREAQLKPFAAERQVLIVPDVHTARTSVPALLKSVEEPPEATVFVLLADDVPPELATVASRCVEIAFPPVPTEAIAAWLVGRGVEADRARRIAEGASGDLDRARLLADDEGFVARLARWHEAPSRLDGTGYAAVELTRDLLEGVESALEPLRARQAVEAARAEEEADLRGERRSASTKSLADRHRAEARRWRATELKIGLGTMTRVYSARLSDAVHGAPRGEPLPGEVRRCASAVTLLSEATAELRRNPNEALLLEALFTRLGRLRA